ncbi:hypothetical protein HYU17_03315 [Candidatus Woesearchaeota archaeon]|nr:hypothetical protein [Candidatus Woesearchaeota archaeon]
MANYSEEVIELVKKRLAVIPPNVSFSLGKYGDFTRDQLISEVNRMSDAGKAAIEMQLLVLRRMAHFNYAEQQK